MAFFNYILYYVEAGILYAEAGNRGIEGMVKSQVYLIQEKKKTKKRQGEKSTALN